MVTFLILACLYRKGAPPRAVLAAPPSVCSILLCKILFIGNVVGVNRHSTQEGMRNLILPTVDDKVLIRQARSGSMDALGDLYARHAEPVYRMALRILGSPAEAEDVLQDVFVGLPSTLKRFDEERDLGPWLTRVSARLALSRIRSKGRQHQREQSYASESPPETSSVQLEQRLRLERALDEVPDSLRPVLLLKEVEGYSHHEIADLLDITPGASAVRLHRALKILRQVLRRSE